MGIRNLFIQDISLRLSDGNNVIEKVVVSELKKEKVDVLVAPGTNALIGGVVYKGRELPYKLQRNMLGIKKGTADIFIYPDKTFDSINISFFGGQHLVSISSLPTAKAKFAIVGTASVEISDYKELIRFFSRTMTRDDLVESINQNVRAHLSNEVNVAASKYITAETTEVTLCAALDRVSAEVMSSRKTASVLMNMGFILSAKGISMHLNAIDDTEGKIAAINNALTGKAIAGLGNDLLDRQEREAAAARQHEIDLIRAQRTDISENTDTRNINTNSNTQGGNVIINNNAPARGTQQAGRNYCPNCGARLTGTGKFCPECGAKL